MTGLFSANGAVFSPCRTYRYQLTRRWGRGPAITWLLLNPSTADETKNDPTIERCQRRSVHMGFGGMLVANLFACRATSPSDMKAHPEPVGPENDDTILEACSGVGMVVAGWGNDGRHLGRSAAVLKLLGEAGIALHALRISAAGEPWHPLYVRYDVRPAAVDAKSPTWPRN